VDRSNADSALNLVLDINAGAGHAVSRSLTNLLSSSQRMAAGSVLCCKRQGTEPRPVLSRRLDLALRFGQFADRCLWKRSRRGNSYKLHFANRFLRALLSRRLSFNPERAKDRQNRLPGPLDLSLFTIVFTVFESRDLSKALGVTLTLQHQINYLDINVACHFE